jgi:hypothetical protein
MWPLLLVLAVGAVSLTIWAYRQTWPRPSASLGRVLTALRSAALVLLVIAIGGPVISSIRNTTDRPELVLVLEDSASMGISDAGVRSDGGTDSDAVVDRWGRALELAAAVDSSLAAAGHELRSVLLRGNGLDALGEFSREELESGSPIAQGTDLDQLLRQVRTRIAGRPARAIVLFSDGQETVGQGAFGTNQGLGGGGRSRTRGGGSIPLVAVGVGDSQGPADRLLKDLRYPGTAYQGDEVVVEMAVDHRFTGSAPLPPVTARLHGPDGVVAEVIVPIEQDLVSLELVFRPDTVGPQVYRLEVSALENERFLENNEVSLAIDVRQERARLLLLCERPGWDVRFLAQAAAREHRLAVSIVYAGPRGLVYADSLVRWQEPATVAEWSEWDGVIVAGWSGELAKLDWARLASATDGGMGMLVLPGHRTGSRAEPLTNIPTALRELLPITASPGRWISNAFSLVAEREALDHLVLEGMVDPDGPAPGAVTMGLQELPPLREVVQTGSRPGSRVLLNARGRSGSAEGSNDLPVLVASSRGSGRIAWFGGRNLWELAFWESEDLGGANPRDSEQVARRLVRNLLLWTAEGDQERELVFSGRRASYQEGENIRLSARWRDLRGQPVTGGKLALTLNSSETGGAGPGERTFPLQNVSDDPGAFEVVLPPLPPGAHSIQLVGQGDPPVLSRKENLIVTRHSVEATQVRQESRRLGQLAGGPGDSYVDGHRRQTLVEILGRLENLDWTARAKVDKASRDLLSGWPFLVTMSLLLGLEWFLRRRNGML